MDFSLTEALQDQSVLDDMSEQQLDNLIREYPYTSWLHVLNALKKKRAGTLTDADVHRAAMYSTDRGKLYEWLELELPILQEKQGTEDVEQGTGDEEKGTGDVELGTEDVEQGTGDRERGTGDEEKGTGDVELGTEDVEQGTGDVELGTGNEEVEEGPMIEGKVLQKLVKDGRVEDPEEFFEEEDEDEEQGTSYEEQGTRNKEGERGELEVGSVEREEPEKTEATMSKEKDKEDLGEDWSFIAWLAEHRSGSGTGNEEKGTGNEEQGTGNEEAERGEHRAVRREEREEMEVGTGNEEVKNEEKPRKQEKKKKSGTKKVVSKKSKKKKKKPLKKLIEKSIILDHDIASEPLADLLASQGHIQQALDMYERLSLIFPEKSAFFAQKIKKLKKK